MKKALSITFALLLLLPISLKIWLEFPLVNNPQRLESARLEALQRYQARQSRLSNPEHNAYFSPAFEPFWGDRTDYRKGCRTEKIVYHWNELVYSMERDTEKPSAKRYEAARLAMESLLPELETQLSKSLLQSPRPGLRTLDQSPLMLINVQRLSVALGGLTEYYIAQDQFASAKSAIRLRFRLGQLLQGQGCPLTPTLGGLIQLRACDSIEKLLEKPLSALQYQQLAGEILDFMPPEGVLDEVAGDAVLSLTTTISRMKTDRVFRKRLSRDLRLFQESTILDREERILLNLVSEISTRTHSVDSSAEAWFQGRSSGLFAELESFMDRFERQNAFTNLRLRGGILSALLRSHREQKGEFPRDLAELQSPVQCDDFTWEAGRLSVVLNSHLEEGLEAEDMGLWRLQPGQLSLTVR